MDNIDAPSIGQFEDFLGHVLLGIVDDMIDPEAAQEVYGGRLAGRADDLQPMDPGHLNRNVPESTASPGNVDPLTLMSRNVSGQDHVLVNCRERNSEGTGFGSRHCPRGTILSGWPLTTTYSA